MKMIKKQRIIFFCFFFLTFLRSQNENFVISSDADSSKKFSRNDLKENIGREIKEALNNCAELSNQIGKVQIQLSRVQKQLFEKIEQLIDNKHPFKKANRANLTDTFKVIKTVKNELINQVEGVKKISLQINNDNCLRKS